MRGLSCACHGDVDSTLMTAETVGRIGLNPDTRIRKVVLDRDRLAVAAEWMRQTMTELRKHHGETG